MNDAHFPEMQHPLVNRRTALQAGGVGLLGLGIDQLQALRAAETTSSPELSGGGKAKSCIYIFLSGGLSQLDSFDLKPHAPDGIRGEFSPIATKTPGIDICEHLPLWPSRVTIGRWCDNSRIRRTVTPGGITLCSPVEPISRQVSEEIANHAPAIGLRLPRSSASRFRSEATTYRRQWFCRNG